MVKVQRNLICLLMIPGSRENLQHQEYHLTQGKCLIIKLQKIKVLFEKQSLIKKDDGSNLRSQICFFHCQAQLHNLRKIIVIAEMIIIEVIIIQFRSIKGQKNPCEPCRLYQNYGLL